MRQVSDTVLSLNLLTDTASRGYMMHVARTVAAQELRV
jgi:hypothetical protein